MVFVSDAFSWRKRCFPLVKTVLSPEENNAFPFCRFRVKVYEYHDE